MEVKARPMPTRAQKGAFSFQQGHQVTESYKVVSELSLAENAQAEAIDQLLLNFSSDGETELDFQGEPLSPRIQCMVKWQRL